MKLKPHIFFAIAGGLWAGSLAFFAVFMALYDLEVPEWFIIFVFISHSLQSLVEAGERFSAHPPEEKEQADE